MTTPFENDHLPSTNGGGQTLPADERFLAATDIVDWQTPSLRVLASRLASTGGDELETARHCFEWVRDEIRHSCDHQLNPVTCSASEVLAHGTGFCYAKSHLLAALLRANGIPAGFCYQRLSLNDHGPAFCLHGLNAVYLRSFGWYRVDPRGNRTGISAEFCPPAERLAFSTNLPGEGLHSEIRDAPLPLVVASLRAHETWEAMSRNLPDWDWPGLKLGGGEQD